MSYIYEDDDSDVRDQNAAISRISGVMGRIQLEQVTGITEVMPKMVKAAVNSISNNVTTDARKQIEDLKRQKVRKKSALTKARRAMLILLDEDLPSRREIRRQQQKVEDCQEEAMGVMEALMDKYLAQGDQEGVKKINEELEIIERECTSAQNREQEYLDSRAHEESSTASGKSARMKMSQVKKDQTEQWRIEGDERRKHLRQLEKETELIKDNRKILDPRVIKEKEKKILREIEMEQQEQRQREMKINLIINQQQQQQQQQKEEVKTKREDNANIRGENQELIGRDLWKQLRRVSIPIFDGNKSTYESWKAAFTACIDQAPATPEYKLLQLRQHLAGDTLKCIENLEHSAGAYEASKNRLESKFGESCRRLAIYIEQLEGFRSIQYGNAKDVEEFSDLLDVAIINLRESQQYHELGTGPLYMKLQRKLPEMMLANYHRWIFENNHLESIETLRDWIVQEAEFQTIATETIKGITANQKKKKHNNGTFFSDPKVYNFKQCKICNGKHGVWKCEVFQRMDINSKWSAVKKEKLCFCCLGDDHYSKDCKRRRKCGIKNCDKDDHKMLHFQKKDDSTKDGGDGANGQDGPQSNQIQKSDGEQTLSTVSKNDSQVALRTVPVILSNGTNKLVVNALLDDGSTKSYVNSDVAFQLQTHGSVQ